MSNIELFRFEAWSSLDDEFHRSARWGTREGIRRISAVPIEKSMVVVEGALVQFEYDGITTKDFNPETAPPRPAGFPTKVKTNPWDP